MKLVATIAVIAMIVAVAFASYSKDHNNWTFERYLSNFPRSYASSNDVFELETRRVIFQSNMATIKAHNDRYEQGLETWFMRPNVFADLTQEEFESQHLGFDKSSPAYKNRRSHRLQNMGASSTIRDFADIDWEAKGVMPPVVNQGSCGSCWANAAATVLGGRANVAFGETGAKNYPSRQQINSCTPNPHECGGSGGCQGSTAQLAYDYLKTAGGVALESEYPYTSGSGQTGTCKDTQHPKAIVISGHVDVQPNNRTALYEALKEGPVSVSAYASNWSFYGGGIFTKCDKYEINHAISLTAMAKDASGQFYYKIMNSWGSSWGEKGSMRLQMAAPDQQEPCGTDTAPYDGSACKDDPSPRTLACGCTGILFDSTFPVGIKRA